MTQDARICNPMARGQKQIELGANSLARSPELRTKLPKSSRMGSFVHKLSYSFKPFPPSGSLGEESELYDPQVNFAIERIKLTSSTGFMVVLVYGRVRPTPL